MDRVIMKRFIGCLRSMILDRVVMKRSYLVASTT